jgi:signal transduction histidine kinase/ActR/RegA family two-component response regulator
MGPTVHVVILDIRLRGRDGFWTYRAIRTRFPDTPMIFYSAYQDLKDPYEVINDYRPFAFLVKDGDLARLQQVVDEAVAVHAAKLGQDRHRLSTERLATVGTLAAAAAHEINNPLTFVLGNLEQAEKLLTERQGDQREVLEAIRLSLTGSKRIAEIVRSLQAYGRVGSSRKWRTDLREAVELAGKMVEGEVRSRARLEIQLGATDPVACEPGELTQILVNLLVNAAQALPVGKAKENRIELRTLRDSAEVVLQISDTGPGVDQEIRDRVFEPFVTTRPAERGNTGLGLFVTHNLVTSAGGTIRLMESAPSWGASFEIRLPVARPDTADDRETPSLAQEVTPPRHRVLVIDDEPLVGRTIKRSLPMHDVDWVGDGPTAFQRLAEREYDAILCDITMPQCNGRDVFEHIKRNHPGLERRMVFLTGGAFDPELQAFVENIRNFVLLKPLTGRDLALAIEKVIAQEAVNHSDS